METEGGSTPRSFPDTIVGRDPDALDTAVALPADAIDAGCYIEGSVPQKQTSLLHKWCVQWAESGHGFCYVHPRGPATRDLLARLPADRLDDVVWIDLHRGPLADDLNVPRLIRVGIDPFKTVTDDASDELLADPIAARVTDCLDVFSENDRSFTRPVAAIWSTLLPWVFSEPELTIREVTRRMRSLRHGGSLENLLDLGPTEHRPMARIHLARATQTATDVFRKAPSLAGWLLDPVPSNALLGETTYVVGEALDNDHIVIVTGDLPHDDPTFTNDFGRLGTLLLVWTVVRRLWEASQRTGPAPDQTFPLVIDRITELVPGEGIRLRELLTENTDLSLAPVLSGQPSSHLPDRVSFTVTEHVGTEISFSEHADEEVETSLRTGDLAPVERALDAETGTVGEAPLCWVRTGQDFLMSGNPRADRRHRPVIPVSPPPHRHDRAEIARAITRSVERHGREPEWLDEDMKADVRSN